MMGSWQLNSSAMEKLDKKLTWNVTWVFLRQLNRLTIRLRMLISYNCSRCFLPPVSESQNSPCGGGWRLYFRTDASRRPGSAWGRCVVCVTETPQRAENPAAERNVDPHLCVCVCACSKTVCCREEFENLLEEKMH